jgi:hypothetical protein
VPLSRPEVAGGDSDSELELTSSSSQLSATVCLAGGFFDFVDFAAGLRVILETPEVTSVEASAGVMMSRAVGHDWHWQLRDMGKRVKHSKANARVTACLSLLTR